MQGPREAGKTKEVLNNVFFTCSSAIYSHPPDRTNLRTAGYAALVALAHKCPSRGNVRAANKILFQGPNPTVVLLFIFVRD